MYQKLPRMSRSDHSIHNINDEFDTADQLELRKMIANSSTRMNSNKKSNLCNICIHSIIILAIMVCVVNYGTQPIVEPTLDAMFQKRESLPAFWNIMQYTMECCGVKSPIEWIPNTPNSCCRVLIDNECIAIVNAHPHGCRDVVSSTLNSLIFITCGICLVVNFIRTLIWTGRN